MLRSPYMTTSIALLLSLLLLQLSPVAYGQASSSGSSRNYGAWSVECRSKGNTPECAATQVVANDPDGKNVVLGVIIESRGAGQDPLITFRFTNRIFRPAGAGLKIDDNEPFRAPIASCDNAICEVRAGLTDEMARQMRTGRLLVFAFFLDEDRQISFPVSLNGVSQTLDELSAR